MAIFDLFIRRCRCTSVVNHCLDQRTGGANMKSRFHVRIIHGDAILTRLSRHCCINNFAKDRSLLCCVITHMVMGYHPDYIRIITQCSQIKVVDLEIKEYYRFLRDLTSLMNRVPESESSIDFKDSGRAARVNSFKHRIHTASSTNINLKRIIASIIPSHHCIQNMQQSDALFRRQTTRI